MNTTTYDPTTNLVSISPAARWLYVYQTLDQLNVSIPGARLGPVGAGGMLTGGGFSFYLYQRGPSPATTCSTSRSCSPTGPSRPPTPTRTLTYGLR